MMTELSSVQANFEISHTHPNSPDSESEFIREGSNPPAAMQLSPERHPASLRYFPPGRKSSQQASQTIDQFWNEQDDGWW